ncbi:glycosyl transferase family 90-domain-containing protein [Mycena floridula]|nr:glycosyl transferase family 90-domain-containing protein [Mycena floridula]
MFSTSRRRHGTRTLIIPLLILLYLAVSFTSFEFPFFDYDGPEYLDESAWAAPASSVPLGKHLYRDDGLLEVNQDGPHPIFELMKDAEDKWRRKIAAASTSLPQAVREYQRRYKRDPPKGFDSWWNYVKLHNVQLPDDYDSIHDDLEPFWGLQPNDLIQSLSEQESRTDHDSYTIAKNDTTRVGVVHTSFAPGKYEDLISGSVRIVDLLRDVDEFLPSFRAVFSPHDVPMRLSDYNVKKAHLNAASSQIYLPAAPDISTKGWASACAPYSPLALLHPINLDKPFPSKSTKSFIHDHVKLMDPCLHPEIIWNHGQFLGHNSPIPEQTMVPEFTQCSTTIHHDIRIPTPYQWLDDISSWENPGWTHQTDKRLLWRGINTGIFYAEDTRWLKSHRTALVEQTNDLNGTVNLLISPTTALEPIGQPRTVSKSVLNSALFDVAFAPQPTQCTPGLCSFLKKTFRWSKKMSVRKAGFYRYVLDVDGNGWSGRFKRLMTSKAVIFKSTVYPEWYTERIAPWLHYVPVQVDLSDLHDVLVFFRGDAEGHGAHENLARKIALEGRAWSRSFWRREDMVAYFFRLMLEYARVMSPDREAMTFDVDSVLEN